ncbi:MAG: TIGR02444 family protein [Alphaproteobacteria bacterium]|nr:TIGR02444 family protein [Alphaproteobacteria bacterium]
MKFSKNPFWNFSVKVYGREGVHDACLALQFSHKTDVNLLLYCCWAGVIGATPLSKEQFSKANKATEDWHRQVVTPIWQAQRNLKETYSSVDNTIQDELRKRLVSFEIDAEHVAQDLLYKAQDLIKEECPDCLLNAEANLKLLFPQRDEKIKASLITVLKGCFPKINSADIGQSL